MTATSTTAAPGAPSRAVPKSPGRRAPSTPDLAHGLRLSVMRLARRVRAERADHGLPLSQMAALATLDRLGPMTAGALAAHEQVRPPSMTKILAALADAGLVERSSDPEDRRQVLLEVTDDARSLLREDRRRRDEWLASLLAALDPDQRAALAAALPVLEVLADS